MFADRACGRAAPGADYAAASEVCSNDPARRSREVAGKPMREVWRASQGMSLPGRECTRNCCAWPDDSSVHIDSVAPVPAARACFGMATHPQTTNTPVISKRTASQGHPPRKRTAMAASRRKLFYQQVGSSKLIAPRVISAADVRAGTPETRAPRPGPAAAPETLPSRQAEIVGLCSAEFFDEVLAKDMNGGTRRVCNPQHNESAHYESNTCHRYLPLIPN
jgi:hypothetical protein